MDFRLSSIIEQDNRTRSIIIDNLIELECIAQRTYDHAMKCRAEHYNNNSRITIMDPSDVNSIPADIIHGNAIPITGGGGGGGGGGYFVDIIYPNIRDVNRDFHNRWNVISKTFDEWIDILGDEPYPLMDGRLYTIRQYITTRYKSILWPQIEYINPPTIDYQRMRLLETKMIGEMKPLLKKLITIYKKLVVPPKQQIPVEMDAYTMKDHIDRIIDDIDDHAMLTSFNDIYGQLVQLDKKLDQIVENNMITVRDITKQIQLHEIENVKKRLERDSELFKFQSHIYHSLFGWFYYGKKVLSPLRVRQPGTGLIDTDLGPNDIRDLNLQIKDPSQQEKVITEGNTTKITDVPGSEQETQHNEVMNKVDENAANNKIKRDEEKNELSQVKMTQQIQQSSEAHQMKLRLAALKLEKQQQALDAKKALDELKFQKEEEEYRKLQLETTEEKERERQAKIKTQMKMNELDHESTANETNEDKLDIELAILKEKLNAAILGNNATETASKIKLKLEIQKLEEEIARRDYRRAQADNTEDAGKNASESHKQKLDAARRMAMLEQKEKQAKIDNTETKTTGLEISNKQQQDIDSIKIKKAKMDLNLDDDMSILKRMEMGGKIDVTRTKIDGLKNNNDHSGVMNGLREKEMTDDVNTKKMLGGLNVKLNAQKVKTNNTKRLV